MKKFSFRFEPLLKLRQLREDQQKHRVSQAAGQVRQLQDQLARDQENIVNYCRFMAQRLTGTIQVEPLIADRRYLNQLHFRQAQCRDQLQQALQQLTQARLQLAQARRQTQIMEKLKDRAWRKYKEELDRFEQRELDEQANTLAAWRMMSAG